MIKPRKAVLEMQEYKPPTSGRGDFLRLDFNENTLGCSPKVMEALKESGFKASAIPVDRNEMEELTDDSGAPNFKSRYIKIAVSLAHDDLLFIDRERLKRLKRCEDISRSKFISEALLMLKTAQETRGGK